MKNLRIPDEYGIVTERARQREVFAEFLNRRFEDFMSSPSNKARMAREVDAHFKREVDELIARKARERMAEIERMEPPQGPAIGDVLNLVAEVTGTTVAEMVGPRRSRRQSWPRFLAIHMLIAMRPDLSLPAIGRALGNRDHTSVMHARNQVVKKQDEAPFAQWLADPRIVEMLDSRPQITRPGSRAFSKLTEEQVRAIRESTMSEREIAAAYGISRSHAGYVRRGAVWKDAA